MIRHLRENWRLWLAAALVITIASVVLVLHARACMLLEGEAPKIEHLRNVFEMPRGYVY